MAELLDHDLEQRTRQLRSASAPVRALLLSREIRNDPQVQEKAFEGVRDFESRGQRSTQARFE